MFFNRIAFYSCVQRGALLKIKIIKVRYDTLFKLKWYTSIRRPYFESNSISGLSKSGFWVSGYWRRSPVTECPGYRSKNTYGMIWNPDKKVSKLTNLDIKSSMLFDASIIRKSGNPETGVPLCSEKRFAVSCAYN